MGQTTRDGKHAFGLPRDILLICLQECDALLRELLPAAFHPSIPFISPYLLTSFGSFTRMDYGTGHETSFMLFLMCLVYLRFIPHEPPVERQLVLGVFVQYVKLCWRLQDVYKLEPAGSHGVWGLDDYSFLTYVFGSAQLQGAPQQWRNPLVLADKEKAIDQTEIPVSAVLRPPLPPTNLYFMSITRILQVKSGPFHEHSSQLYAIATGVQHWTKVHSGMLKMYEVRGPVSVWLFVASNNARPRFSGGSPRKTRGGTAHPARGSCEMGPLAKNAAAHCGATPGSP